METKKKALGKGLEQLFSNTVIDFDNFEKDIVEENEKNVTEINIDDIRSNPYQPRKTFDIESLNELAKSIKEYGVVQPIIVKKSIKGYELVAGERRTKAAKIAGLKKIPAIIKDFDDQEMMEIALVENIQREDLNPIDEATSISNIIKLRGYTQEEFANKFGKSRTYVTNILGLLKLPDEVKKLVEKRSLSMSHARVLSKIEDDDKVIDLAKKVITDSLSVHDLEKMSQEEKQVNNKSKNKSNYDTKYRMFENIIMDALNTKVRVHKNKIEVYFDGVNELEDILAKMHIDIEDE
ncbi:MAG TPA: ParB/RepB/Spo0J family partition protein [Candidatus Onthocola stercoravium]|nr:ParB/RepB/Spo0J family partition protein [Candidatus Onthocola stercoravium]